MTGGQAAGAAQQGGRVIGLDVARGLLMAYVVVVIHGMFWLRFVPQPVASIFLLEMPLIFMVSGAAYYYGQLPRATSAREAIGNYVGYLLSRGVRILAPYFAFALVAACIVIAVRKLDPIATFAAWFDLLRTGTGFSYSTLNWHLWFIPPFLGVTMLMPLLARLPAWGRAPLWAWAVLGGLIMLTIDALHAPSLRLFAMIVFYGLWALFGFGVAAAPKRFGLRSYALVLVVSLVLLAAVLLLLPERTDTNMQHNKFPPNAVFYVFSCAWVSAVMIGVKMLRPDHVEALANFALLKPFIRAGYSIYLWQGLGYTAAIWLGQQVNASVWLVWPVGVVLTVILGLVASPLERIRIRRKPRADKDQPLRANSAASS